MFDDLGTSLARVWDAASTTMRDRKRLLACLMEEVVLSVDRAARQVNAVVYWRGGHIDEFEMPLPKRKVPEPARDDRSTIELIRHLAGYYKDADTAHILNRQERRTAHGLLFSGPLVGELRRRHGIPAYSSGEWAKGDACVLMSVPEASRELGVSQNTLYRWIQRGLVPVVQPDVAGAPMRVPMTAGIREKFCQEPPAGYLPLAVAVKRLGVSRQTIWQRVASGKLDACHVARGAARGLYVRPEDLELPSLGTVFDEIQT